MCLSIMVIFGYVRNVAKSMLSTFLPAITTSILFISLSSFFNEFTRIFPPCTILIFPKNKNLGLLLQKTPTTSLPIFFIEYSFGKLYLKWGTYSLFCLYFISFKMLFVLSE